MLLDIVKEAVEKVHEIILVIAGRDRSRQVRFGIDLYLGSDGIKATACVTTDL